LRENFVAEKGAETQEYFLYFRIAVSGFAAYGYCIPLAGTSFRNEFMTQNFRKAPQTILCDVAVGKDVDGDSKLSGNASESRWLVKTGASTAKPNITPEFRRRTARSQ
jgi:hypothetical protein